MTSYSLLLEEMSVHGLTWHDDLEPIGIETSVGRLDSSSDMKPLLRSQTSVRGLLHDKSADDQRQGRFGRRALATGGIIERRPDTIV